MKSHSKINFWTEQLSITHKKQLYAVFLFMDTRKLNLPISSIGHVWCWKLFRMWSKVKLNHPQIYTQTLQWKYKPSIKRCGKWNKKSASQFFKFIVFICSSGQYYWHWYSTHCASNNIICSGFIWVNREDMITWYPVRISERT